MKVKHILKMSTRTISLEIIDEPNQVIMVLRCTKYGLNGDLKEIIAWMAPIFEPYDSDPRRFVMAAPDLGESQVTRGDCTNLKALVWSFDEA